MYKLNIESKAAKFISTLPKNIRLILIEKFDLLIQNPFDFRLLDIKKLKGNKFRYRLRVGQYRFIYSIVNENVILISKAAHRKDIYK